ncbi:MAG: endonuclease/exonuclease/phosphatase family protein [Candidatus Thermoplasmatota archaeon]|nr:endonuclease/exonuclease/phosphatase family protein [Candidatus Thermoplasmatota archaeon]
MIGAKKGTETSDRNLVLKTNTRHSVLWIALVMLVVLFLLQTYREFLSAVYFFNLVGLGVSPVSVLILLFLVVLLLGPLVRLLGYRNSFFILGAVTISGRLPMGMGLETPLHLIFSGITFASSSLFLFLLLALHRREREVDPEVFSSQSLAGSFGLALLVLLALSALGLGVDPSIVPEAAGFLLAPALSTALCGATAFLLFLLRDAPILDDDRGGKGGPGSIITGGGADSWAPAFGLGAFIYFSIGIVANPSVTSAWVGTTYQWALSMSIVSVGSFLLSLLSPSGYLLALRRSFAHPKGAILGNLLLLLSAVNLFYLHYPLPPSIPVQPVGLVWIGMVDTWLILDALTDNRPFAGESFMLHRKEGSRVIGFPARSRNRGFPGHFGRIGAVALGSVTFIFLLVTLSLNWSFLPMGWMLKDSIPTFMFLGMMMLALSGFACSTAKAEEPVARMGRTEIEFRRGSPTIDAEKGSGHLWKRSEGSQRIRGQLITIGAFTIVLIILTGILSVTIYSGEVQQKNVLPGETIRVVTYNVHHGYANDGRVDPTVEYEVLKDIDADIIFLQESDSLRFTEGNFDPAFYYASRLDMFLFRGPDPGTGTPGVAILSRMEMKDLKVHFLPADDIPRIAISATVRMGESDVRLVGLHMGLEGSEREKQLIFLRDLFHNSTMDNPGLIVGGDFNTEPYEPMMAWMNPYLFGNGSLRSDTTGPHLNLSSAWHSVEESGRNDILDINTYPSSDVDDEKAHIDYILFNDMFEVKSANVLNIRGASDHKPVWADLVLGSGMVD